MGAPLRMMVGRSFVLAVLLAAALPAGAGEKRVIALRSGDLSFYNLAVQGFEEGLRAQKVSFKMENRVLPANEADLPGFLSALEAEKPDLVLTVGTPAVRALKERNGPLPFIYCMIVDPDGLALQTGGAVMEVRPGAQLQYIQSQFPSMRRVGVVHSTSRSRATVRFLKEEKPEGITLVMVTADTPEEMSKAIVRLSKEADCLLMVSDGVLYSPQVATQIILQTIQNNLPLIAISPSFVKAGALAAVYPDYKDNGVVAADVAARYFAGTPLNAISAQWAVNVRSAVNLIVAKRLGVSVQEKTVREANEVMR